MKPTLLAVALLSCAPIARAQTTTLPAPPARIDPVALNLLARMSWKYRRTPTYDTYIRASSSRGEDGQSSSLARFQTSGFGEFVLSMQTGGDGWRRWIFGGSNTLVGFDSLFPKRYTRQRVAMPADYNGNRAMNVALENITRNHITLFELMNGNFPGDVLSNPHLVEVSMTEDAGAKVVLMGLNDDRLKPKDNMADFIKLWIDPQTLVLQKVNKQITLFGAQGPAEVIFETEIYPRARFDSPSAPGLFRAAAPLSYQLIDSFDATIQPPSASNSPQITP